MLRRIGAVIVAYVAMFFVEFIVFSTAFLGLGPDLAFRPGSFVTSGLWGVLSIVFVIAASLLGGYVCAAIGRDRRAVVSLMVLIVAVGLVGVVLELQKPDPGPRTGPVSNLEAMSNARQPAWFVVGTPLLSAAAAWYGGRARLARRA